MPNGICAPSHRGVQPKGALPHSVAPHGVSAVGQGAIPAGFVAAPQAARPRPEGPHRGAAAGGTAGGQEGGRQELLGSHGETRCGAGQKRGVGLAEKDTEWDSAGREGAAASGPARDLAALQMALVCSSFATDGVVLGFP